MDYLSDVQFTNATSEELHARLRIMDPDFIRTQVFAAINTLIDAKAIECKKEWKACTNQCFTTLHELVETETHSTAYMLRALCNMVLSIDTKPNPITFTLRSENPLKLSTLARPSDILTGVWEHDSKYIKMNFDSVAPRLIMGFGPSASGKTYWAKTLITLLSENQTFPKTFLSIDGGILREASLVYQTIVEVIKTQCLAGLDNLVLSSVSLLSSSIFDSEIIKPVLLRFLEIQDKISLYVPETLGGCGSMRPSSCDGKIKKYVSLTGDTQWIGVFIWQHLHGSECTYPVDQRCVGCSETGKGRELKEGKKYSSVSYSHSYSQGLKELAKAPGGQYNIHNCGIPDRLSTIQFKGDEKMLQPLLNGDNQTKYKYFLEIVQEERGGKRRRTRSHAKYKRRSRRGSKKRL
jgi:hypothetical protein